MTVQAHAWQDAGMAPRPTECFYSFFPVAFPETFKTAILVRHSSSSHGRYVHFRTQWFLAEGGTIRFATMRTRSTYGYSITSREMMHLLGNQHLWSANSSSSSISSCGLWPVAWFTPCPAMHVPSSTLCLCQFMSQQIPWQSVSLRTLLQPPILLYWYHHFDWRNTTAVQTNTRRENILLAIAQCYRDYISSWWKLWPACVAAAHRRELNYCLKRCSSRVSVKHKRLTCKMIITTTKRSKG